MALKLLGKKSSKVKEEEGDNSIDTTESTQSKSPSKHHRRGMVNALNRSHSTSKKTRPLSLSPQKSNSLIVSSSNSSKVKKPKLSTADTSYEDRRYNLPENQETQTDIDQSSHDKMNSMEDRIALRQDQNDPAISFDVKLASAQGSELLLNPPTKDTTDRSSTTSSFKQPFPHSPSKSQLSNQETGTSPQPQPPKSESNGFLSSLLNAAANKMISSTPPSPPPEDKKKDHSFSSKLDTLLRGVKHEGSKSSLVDGAATASADVDSLENKQITNSTELKSIHSLTHDVQFEPVRESPLNTLGNGDLSLADFDNKFAREELGMGSRRPSFRSADSITKRATTPELMPNSGSLNGGDTRRLLSRSLNRSNSSLISIPQRPSSLGKSPVADSRMAKSSDDPNRNSTITENGRVDDNDSGVLPGNFDTENIEDIVDYTKKIKHASKKRNKEFHQNFKKLPTKEKLIDDFSCAVSKDILVQGKMYLSDHYVCFNSNILGWVTNLVIPLQEVIQIEKKSTAVLFPNGIVIRTLHQKYVFATFLSRDSTFDLITNVWHRVLLENSDIDPKKLQAQINKGKRRARAGSRVSNFSSTSRGSDEDNDNSSFDEDEDANDSGHDASLESDDFESDGKPSDASESKDGDVAATSGSGNTFKGLPIVGPLTHAPTETGYSKESSETFISEDTIKAPPGAVYLIMFGTDTSKYIRILKDQKNFDISESKIKALTKENKERSYTYTKPLSGPIGPKQTKCNIEDKLIEYQPEKFYEVEQTTQTPDVPSGNSFKVKTKIFLSWAANNETKVYVVTSIEWSGKSWIKGAIEKGTIEGQKDSMKSMISTINSIVSQGSDKKEGANGKRKSRSRKGTLKKEQEEEEVIKVEQSETPKSISEQFMTLVDTIGGLIPIPFLSNTVVGFIIVLIGFLTTVSVFNRLTSTSPKQYIELIPNDYLYASRIQIRDNKLKRQEELSLWSWLNNRSEGRLNLNYKAPSLDELDDSDLKSKYGEQELKEIVRLTRIKLDKLSEKLDDL
ncbi:GRAM domain family protein [Candida albicans]|uniref:GRAM domain family protein n=1 Tax=Candida albicans TaxID=5476 RepID=A0A8H6BRG7_CANAX|nr:GRAM domain family protein [Candida albicans]